jgi:Uma2 family endonuclease
VSTAKKLPTYEDVLSAPENVVAEIVNDVLYTHPRPRTIHSQAASTLGEELGPPFKRGRNGPGGWMLLDEPELHLGRAILVPDLAGWRRERLPELPDAPFLTVAPDWVCEVLSPSTEQLDRAEKLPLYARQGVAHAWLVNPEVRTLEVLRLDGATFRLISTHREGDRVRAEPFEAFELDLALLWAR